MKTCPFCAGEIQDAATKCRYCDANIVNAPASTALAAPVPATPVPPATIAAPPEAPLKGIWIKAIIYHLLLAIPLTVALTFAIALVISSGGSGDGPAMAGALFLGIAPPFIFPIAAFIVCAAWLLIIKSLNKFPAYAKPLRFCLFFWVGMMAIAVVIAALLFS